MRDRRVISPRRRGVPAGRHRPATGGGGSRQLRVERPGSTSAQAADGRPRPRRSRSPSPCQCRRRPGSRLVGARPPPGRHAAARAGSARSALAGREAIAQVAPGDLEQGGVPPLEEIEADDLGPGLAPRLLQPGLTAGPLGPKGSLAAGGCPAPPADQCCSPGFALTMPRGSPGPPSLLTVPKVRGWVTRRAWAVAATGASGLSAVYIHRRRQHAIMSEEDRGPHEAILDLRR